jgi:SAM-dependent methyltransferase
LALTPKSVLDYGCGTGTATPYLIDVLGAERVVGVDVSAESLNVARKSNAHLAVEYRLVDEFAPSSTMDLVFCNGVFHHICPKEREAAARYVANSLRPGGVFAMWENNPWSPAARYVMSRIPFDRDAVMVWPHEARSLAEGAGLSAIRTDYAFVFPRSLRLLRVIEPLARRLPLGAQYQVLARKPKSARPGDSMAPRAQIRGQTLADI